MRQTNDSGPLLIKNFDTGFSEAFRIIRTSIKHSSIDQNRNCILFTSSSAGEGKTTVVANLGILTAQDNKRTLLIDCDLRKPNLHYLFGVHNRLGLSSILTGYATLEQSVIRTETEKLFLLPAGPIPTNPTELLGSASFQALLRSCADQFDAIFIDSPSILNFSDPLIICRHIDSIVVVTRAMHTTTDNIKKMKSKLEPFSSKVLGVILNDKKRLP
jgi:capsular exopolysaccharide synthesis family protein